MGSSDCVDELLVEAGVNGAVIHSNSWGDATTAYTARTGDFDSWALEMPWSLAFVAPGNNGGQLMEPSNGKERCCCWSINEVTNLGIMAILFN